MALGLAALLWPVAGRLRLPFAALGLAGVAATALAFGAPASLRVAGFGMLGLVLADAALAGLVLAPPTQARTRRLAWRGHWGLRFAGHCLIAAAFLAPPA